MMDYLIFNYRPPIIDDAGTSRRHKLISQIRKVASSDLKKDLNLPVNLNKTTYSYAEERAKNNKINPSSSSNNTFSVHDSYLSEKKKKNSGFVSPALQLDASNSKLIKKPRRKTFTTTKKKLGPINIIPNTEKIISPSVKLKSKNKVKSVPFPQNNSAKFTRGKVVNDSPNSSFTVEGGMDGKNLIDEFNQKYAVSEKAELNNDSSDPSDSETNKTNDTCIDGNVAIIHVIDETKKRKQDFKCSITKLLKHMKYFEK
jgi:hypothetical protein